MTTTEMIATAMIFKPSKFSSVLTYSMCLHTFLRLFSDSWAISMTFFLPITVCNGELSSTASIVLTMLGVAASGRGPCDGADWLPKINAAGSLASGVSRVSCDYVSAVSEHFQGGCGYFWRQKGVRRYIIHV